MTCDAWLDSAQFTCHVKSPQRFERELIQVIFSSIYARVYYAQPRAHIISFSSIVFPTAQQMQQQRNLLLEWRKKRTCNTRSQLYFAPRTGLYISRNPHETGTRTTYNAHCHSKVLLHFDLVMTRRLSSLIFCDMFDSVSMVHSDFFTLWLA